MNPKLMFQTFFKKHGTFFVIIYLLAFFGLVTLNKTFGFQAFPGDIQTEVLGFQIYLPFVGALAFAVFIIVIFGIYKGLKTP